MSGPSSPEEQAEVLRHLVAASGYLELRMPMEAWNELEAIEPALRAKREVLEMRLEVCRLLEKWEMMAEISRFFAGHEPDEPGHVLNLAYAVRRHQNVEAAEAMLVDAMVRFPESALIRYNLACYRSVMGRVDDAKKLLAEAFSRDASLRITALDDPDLAGVW